MSDSSDGKYMYMCYLTKRGKQYLFWVGSEELNVSISMLSSFRRIIYNW